MRSHLPQWESRQAKSANATAEPGATPAWTVRLSRITRRPRFEAAMPAAQLRWRPARWPARRKTCPRTRRRSGFARWDAGLRPNPVRAAANRSRRWSRAGNSVGEQGLSHALYPERRSSRRLPTISKASWSTGDRVPCLSAQGRSSPSPTGSAEVDNSVLSKRSS